MMLLGFRNFVEYLAGQCDDVPPSLANVPPWIYRSLVWMLALLLIYFFCGQSTKFIYIDF
jgi:hypothetical protein